MFCYKIAELKEAILIFPSFSYIPLCYLLLTFFNFTVRFYQNSQNTLIFKGKIWEKLQGCLTILRL